MAGKKKAPQDTAGAPALSIAAEFKPRPCPICSKPSTFEMRPFCSKRCADIDLHHWLGGSYAIPAVEQNPAEGEGPGEEEE